MSTTISSNFLSIENEIYQLSRLEHNARVLNKYKFLTVKNYNKLVGISSWNFLKIIYFYVKDHSICSWYKKTQKIQKVVLRTLEAMNEKIKKDIPHFYFKAIKFNSKNSSYEGYFIPFSKLEKIKNYWIFQNNEKIQNFKFIKPEEIDFTNGLEIKPSLTKRDKDIINEFFFKKIMNNYELSEEEGSQEHLCSAKNSANFKKLTKKNFLKCCKNDHKEKYLEALKEILKITETTNTFSFKGSQKNIINKLSQNYDLTLKKFKISL